MFPEDLLFWIAPLDEVPAGEHNVLCRRHADAMVVPRGWTLDDRREPIPRLFMPRRSESAVEEPAATAVRPQRRRRQPEVEQLQIDGTGEIERPPSEPESDDASAEKPVAPWRPEFDENDDLDGLLEVRSPLLARAFRGKDRPRT
jgi:hypothetical protein